MKQRKPQEYFVYFKDFAVHSSDKRTGGWPQAGVCSCQIQKKRTLKRPCILTFLPHWKGGNINRFAYCLR